MACTLWEVAFSHCPVEAAVDDVDTPSGSNRRGRRNPRDALLCTIGLPVPPATLGLPGPSSVAAPFWLCTRAVGSLPLRAPELSAGSPKRSRPRPAHKPAVLFRRPRSEES